MSLFVALVPPEHAIDDLADRVQSARRQPAASTLHWQPASRWHVTVAFLGDADDKCDDIVGSQLDGVAATLPMPTLHIAGSGCFGGQILWAGVAGFTAADDDLLADLARVVHTRLAAAGLQVERRHWRPHLTLARSRGTDARPAVGLLQNYVGPAWPVTALLTIRSTGGPQPTHTVVHTSHATPVTSPADDLDG